MMGGENKVDDFLLQAKLDFMSVMEQNNIHMIETFGLGEMGYTFVFFTAVMTYLAPFFAIFGIYKIFRLNQ